MNIDFGQEDWKDWREEEETKIKYKTPKIRDLFPINYEEEKEKFFAGGQHQCPHFIYKEVVSPESLKINQEHQAIAAKILVNNKFRSPKLPALSKEQVIQIINKYLQKLGLEDYVELKFQHSCLSRTSVAYFKDKIVLKIRTPINYNAKNLQGVLNHEVGTHIIRMLNHRNNCVQKPSQHGRVIEEGLAAINQLLPEERPFLFKAALRYMSSIWAHQFGFIEVYKNIGKYIRDKNDCWRETVRVKRGMSNTEDKGGYYKDQTYLIGAIEILQERKTIDFQKIYYGRLTPQQTCHLSTGVLPPFIDTPQKKVHYLKLLDKIALCNFID